MRYFNLALSDAIKHENLCLKIGGQTFRVHEHTDESRERAVEFNSAFAALPEESQAKMNYYAEVNVEKLPQNRILGLHVTEDDGLFKLPVLHHFSYYIPQQYRMDHLKRKLQRDAKDGLLLAPKLSALGVSEESAQCCRVRKDEVDWLLQLNLDAEQLLTPLDIAKALLFQHPSLANARPDTASIVMDDHIAPDRYYNPEQYQKLYDFATEISRQGPDHWCFRTNVINQTTSKEMVYEYDIGDHKTGDRVEIYDLSEKTLKNAANPLRGALNSANQDSRLQNQTWHVAPGTTCDDRSSASRNFVREEKENTGVTWTLNDETPSHGLNIYKDSIDMKDGTFQITVKNTWLRSLGAYYQFLNDHGDTYGKKEYATLVAPVDTLMGIPLPVWDTKLKFDFPDDASGVKLYFGGLGTSGYDKDVCGEGIALTAVFQLGIPIFFLGLDAGLTSTKVLTDAMKEREFNSQVAQVFMEVTKANIYNGPTIELVYAILEIAGKTIAGILATKLFEKLLAWIIGLVTEQEIAGTVPIAGWILRIANVVMDVAQLTQTIAEVCCSPAVLSAKVTRSMTVKAVVKPDPAHGEPDRPDTAVWPATADNWKIHLLYRGGTNRSECGDFPETTGNTPITIDFTEVPAGGEFKLYASIYSKTGWLCGKWESDWIKALPDQGSDKKAVTGTITEVLVPLTSDVQYEYKEKLTYDGKAYSWHAGDKPVETVKDLNRGGTGEELCRLEHITYSSYCKQAAYVWNASGSELPPVKGADDNLATEYLIQNISVLADKSVNERLKTSEIGFSSQPSIAYDKFGAGKDNFILDPRGGSCHLRKVELMDGSHGFGLSQAALKSYGKFNQDKLDALVIHPDGAAIAVNWNNSKMEILQIPDAPSSDQNAKEAQILSGQGIRQGLMDGPVALKIARDGRIMVLETGNRRIQGFDTQGNPVPGFTGRELLEGDLAALRDDLDQEIFSDALQELFRKAGMDKLFEIEEEQAEQLDKAVFSDDLLHAFAEQGLYLYYDCKDPDGSAVIQIVEKGNVWEITEKARGYRYRLIKENKVVSIYELITQMSVKAVDAGEKWILRDAAGGRAFLARRDERKRDKIQFCDYLSYLQLHKFEKDDTYLDFSIEGAGYMYVLSYSGSGEAVSDYHIDIYEPEGNFLVRTPDSRLQPENPDYPNFAKFEVDDFRNLIALNYEKIIGAGRKPEPSVSQWNPTTPLFELDKNSGSDFSSGNMEKVKTVFKTHGVELTAQAQLETVRADECFRIHDTQVVAGASRQVDFDVILCVDKFYVYRVLVGGERT